MLTEEWMEKYEGMRDRLTCWTDPDSYFTGNMVGNTAVDAMDIGTVSFPSGRILACDPLIELEDRPPFMQTVPPGTYPVTICVMPSEKYGDRYACVKVTVSDAKPVRYDLAMIGDEDLNEDLEDGDYFGFCVDAGMGCIADVETQKAFREYWAKRLEEDEDIDPYNDLFCDLLEESYNENPRYQRDGGDWVNWTVPGTDLSIPIFTSGWGDGVYPCYFGYDSDGNVCGVYILFIDLEEGSKG